MRSRYPQETSHGHHASRLRGLRRALGDPTLELGFWLPERSVYVGASVRLGRNCKIQNNALLYEGLELEDGVFVGPQVCFTNDHLPRAVNPDLSLKSADDWHLGRTLVREGASVGAQSVVVTGVTIGRWALVGAGSVVTHDVPDHALVYGQPARVHGWVCKCARRLDEDGWCEACKQLIELKF